MVEMVSLGCLSGVGLCFTVECFGSLVVLPWGIPFWRWVGGGLKGWDGVVVLFAVGFFLLLGAGG